MTVQYLCCASVAMKKVRFLWSTSVVVMMVQVLCSSSSVIHRNGWQTMCCTWVFVLTLKITCTSMYVFFMITVASGCNDRPFYIFYVTAQFLCCTSVIVVTAQFLWCTSVILGCLLTFGMAVVQRCVSLRRLVIVHSVHVIIGSLKKSHKDLTTIQSTTIY